MFEFFSKLYDGLPSIVRHSISLVLIGIAIGIGYMTFMGRLSAAEAMAQTAQQRAEDIDKKLKGLDARAGIIDKGIAVQTQQLQDMRSDQQTTNALLNQLLLENRQQH